MINKAEIINQILSEWNPIGVGKNVATDEYKGYIPAILQCCNNQKELINCLQKIVVNELELTSDLNNKKLHDDLQIICDKIIQACNICPSRYSSSSASSSEY